MQKIDLLIMGSSRPQLLEYTYKSFKKFVHTDKKVRVLFHEDAIYPGDSMESMKFAEDNNFEVSYHVPNIGLAPAMTKMFQKVETGFIFYLQDDFEFERPVELDRILWVMNKYNDINCITFNKRRNRNDANVLNFSGLKVYKREFWSWNPGVWRMSYVRKKWIGPVRRKPEAKWFKIAGISYIYGEPNEPRYIRHLGDTWRMAEWNMRGNKPGSVKNPDAHIGRAPWLAEPPERPVRSQDASK